MASTSKSSVRIPSNHGFLHYLILGRPSLKLLSSAAVQKCGPGSVKISPATVKQHLERDLETRLKKKRKEEPAAVSMSSFLSARRRKQARPEPQPFNASVQAPSSTDEDVTMDFETNLNTGSQLPTSTSTLFDDVEMPDAFVHAAAAPAVNTSSSDPSQTYPTPAPPSTPSTLPLQPCDSLAEESPFWFWQLILLTTAWMHLHFHTPHRCCDLLLRDKVPVTLTTTFKRLGLNEAFEIHAICPQCRRAYPEDSSSDLMCSQCHVPLFNTPPPPTSTVLSLLASTRPKAPPKSKPILQSPYLLPSTQLVEFLNRDGNEIACESYLTRTPVPGKMHDIQDGDICQSLKGPDGRKFFETGPSCPDPDELRIGLCFGEDGDGNQHKAEAAEYATIPEDDHVAQDAFASSHGTQYFELSRLPYFDPVRQIITDPMHCIFLGIVKTQWLDAWVRDPGAALRKHTEKTPREIDQIHTYLDDIEMPSWVARLPSQVGYAAGGNLTSDEWKGMLLIFCPLILPHIWAEWYPIAVTDHERAKQNWKKKNQARLSRIANATDTAADHKDHPRFRPHLWLLDILFERLNKLLKSYNTNNHGDGELEVTFFHEFQHDADLREALQKLASNDGVDGLSPEEQCIVSSAHMILATDGDVHGTLASMTREIEELSVDLGTKFSMGMAVDKNLPPSLQGDILDYYNTTYPTIPIVAHAADTTNSPGPHIFLHGSALVHGHFILDGRRITSSTSETNTSSSLIQLDAGSTRYVGQIYNIITHKQPGLENPQFLLDVQWMKHLMTLTCLCGTSIQNSRFLRGSMENTFAAKIPVPDALLTIEHKKQIADSNTESDDEGETSSGHSHKIWFTAGLTRDGLTV
ncbi:hypothetical protein C8J57DRAFT_1251282 [Mycena rebaudengoi]|nr:hypothetical protein C8J57DRAFT_1251282 [Mycena rebaudengoi]